MSRQIVRSAQFGDFVVYQRQEGARREGLTQWAVYRESTGEHLADFRRRDSAMKRAREEDERLAAYLESPNHCPICKGTDIEGREVEIDGGTARQSIVCDCGAQWIDVYTLTRIDALSYLPKR
jgi:hypothetical protein